MEYFVVGKILNTHGLKGDLKVRNQSDFDRFYKGAKLSILFMNNYIDVTVISVKEQDRNLLVRFKGLEDINLVEKYKGCLIYIEEENLTILQEDEYYFHELVGKEIYNQENVLRGVVSEVREVPQGHLLVVVVNGKNKFIPFRNEFVKEVGEVIKIEEIEGLL